jgi:hypothetical protein
MIYDPDAATESVDNDLEGLDLPDKALMVELIDLIWESDDVRSRLAEGDYRRLPSPRFDAAPVVSWINAGYNIYRIKLWSTDGTLVGARLLYSVDHRALSARVVLMGIMPRNEAVDEDYDLASDYGKRIKDDYEILGIPPIPRKH